MTHVDKGNRSFLRWSVLIVLLMIGIFLRLPPTAFEGAPLRYLHPVHLESHLKGIGIDEKLYRGYVQQVRERGLLSYPELVREYVQKQRQLPAAILPPLRFLYIFCACLWQNCFGGDAIGALRNIAALFSIFSLLLAAIFAARLKKPGYLLAVTALMAVAPTQLHVSQHAIIDGFFAFWAILAIWSLWETLTNPKQWFWKLLYGFALVSLVLTKENAVFVWFGILAILIGNRWLGIGTVNRELILVTFLAPLIGVGILIWLAGGIPTLIDTYRLFIIKNYGLRYSELEQDGPWHRYLVDLLLVSPIVLLLAVGCLYNLTREKKLEWFLAMFVVSTYAMMCSIRYGINLRFANMWDLPLRMLAVSQLSSLATLVRHRRETVLALCVIVICISEVHNYIALEVRYPLYDLVTTSLVRALKILKGLPY